MTSGDFDMVAAGWGPDFDDPLTFGDLYASWNGNNRGQVQQSGTRSPGPDRAEFARSASRMDAFGEIQRILIDDAVHLPNYERGKVYVQDPDSRASSTEPSGTDPGLHERLPR